jgi:hypothetical protein
MAEELKDLRAIFLEAVEYRILRSERRTSVVPAKEKRS